MAITINTPNTASVKEFNNPYAEGTTEEARPINSQCRLSPSYRRQSSSDSDNCAISMDTMDLDNTRLNKYDLSLDVSTLILNKQLTPSSEDSNYIDSVVNTAKEIILIQKDAKVTDSELDEMLAPIKQLIIIATTRDRKQQITDVFSDYFIDLLFDRIPKQSNIHLYEEFQKKNFGYREHITYLVSETSPEPERMDLLCKAHELLFQVSENNTLDRDKTIAICELLITLQITSSSEIDFLRRLMAELKKVPDVKAPDLESQDVEMQNLAASTFEEKVTAFLEEQTEKIYSDQNLNKADVDRIGFPQFLKNFKDSIITLQKETFDENKKLITSVLKGELAARINHAKEDKNSHTTKVHYLKAANTIYEQLQKNLPSQENEMQFWKIGNSDIGFHDLRKFRPLFHNNRNALDEFKRDFIDAIDRDIFPASEARDRLIFWLKNPFSWNPNTPSNAKIQAPSV